MGIQRYHAYHSGDPHKVGLWADDEGHWVQWADHVAALLTQDQQHMAEVARLSTLIGAAAESAYNDAAETMREACIAAVEAECKLRGLAAAPLTRDLIAALREVKP